jgi:hypothetical protein
MLWPKRRRKPKKRLPASPRPSARRPFHPDLEQLELRVLLAAPTYVFQGAPTATPTGLTPQQIQSAYDINHLYGIIGNGAGQTIAVVTDQDNPNIVGDLHKFDVQFGLPDPPKILKLNQLGGSSLPPPANPGGNSWSGETAVDVEWVHAIAPGANLIVYEADPPDPFAGITIEQNLYQAAATAGKNPGVSVVMMGFGGFSGPPSTAELSTETSIDSTFTTPGSKVGTTGVTFVAATGSRGVGLYPGFSPNVLAAGGTTLTINPTNTYKNETAWSGSGGGISQFEAEPQYQLPIQSTTFRTIPDVAFNSDPKSGVSVYDSYDNSAATPWEKVGGTSLSAAAWAGLVAIADQGERLLSPSNSTLDGPTGTLPDLYNLFKNKPGDFHSITTGGNGTFTASAGTYSTYLGGSGSETATAVATDASGDVYVTGYTNSSDFPTLSAFQASSGGGTNAFVAKFDPTGKRLYSTYLGGSGKGTFGDEAFGIAVDASGDAYVTGLTDSSNFPTTAGALQSALTGKVNAFVAELNPTGTALVYSTYLGGSGSDTASGIAVDSSGDAFITGSTRSSNFPTTAGALQSSLAGTQNAFVAELNATGTGLVYSTYLGGSATDAGNGIALDASGDAFVTGSTTSSNFPTAGALQSALSGTQDAFVAKLNPSGTGLVYSTYLGGSATAVGNGIAVDASGDAFVTGATQSSDFPTTIGAFQSSLKGTQNAFVTELNAAGKGLRYSTYLGGSSTDTGYAIAVDGSGNAFVTGGTDSSDFPTTGGAVKSSLAGTEDAFVTRLNPTQSGAASLLSSTYLGGSATQDGHGIAVDGSGHAFVAGDTSSSDFPTVNAFQSSLAGTQDAFVTAINPVYNLVTGLGTPIANRLVPDMIGMIPIRFQTLTPPPNPVEATDPGTFTLATFTDLDVGDNAGLLTATVTWGDGSTDVYNGGPQIVQTSKGHFAIVTDHIYAEEGTYSISIQLASTFGPTAAASGTVTVADAPLTVTQVNTPLVALTEGQSTGTFTVATFGDSNLNAPVSDFTAVVTWGDGTTSTVTSAGGGITGSAGSYAVLASHTYADEVTSATVLSVQVLDVGGASAGGQSSGTFTVADATLGISAVNRPPAGISEGQNTGTFTVATFTDGDTSAPLTDFTAVVQWGDGTTSTITSANGISGSAGSFVIQASHTYVEEVTTATALSVQVLDEGGASAARQSARFTVLDATLGNLSISKTFATEGSGTGVVTVATFHDTALGSDATDFTVTVNWGDSTSSAASVVFLGTAGDFAVLGSHTYADEAAGIGLSVQVRDVGGARLIGSVSLKVSDAPLGGLTITPPAATEGIGTGPFTVATFTDANLLATATDFTATVTWGDGTSSAATLMATGGGAFAVLGSHTYADETSSPITLSVAVRDVGGSSVSGSVTLTVADGPLTLTAVTAPASPTEGIGTGTFTVATFTDSDPSAPASDFTAVIAWGDGTTSTITSANGLSGSAGSFVVQAAHTYAEQMSTSAVLSVQIFDDGSANATGHSSSFAVADAPLTVTAVSKPGSNLTEGVSTGTFTVATFTDANTGAPLTDFTAVITWGDGTTSTVTGAGGGITGSAGSYAVVAAHTYEEVTTPAVLSVQVLDAGGASARGHSSSFTVADATLTVTQVNAPPATEGRSTGLFTVATFTDGNTVAPLSDYTAVIAWGDGTTSTITSASGLGGSGGNLVVQASHTYAEEMTATLSVQVFDVGGSSASGHTTFTVADAPMTLSAIHTPPTGFTEGIPTGPFTVATFTVDDPAAPASDFTAVVTWGDGGTSTLTSANGGLVSTGGGTFALLGGHAYTDEGSFILSVQVTDVGGASAHGGSAVAVNDAPLTLNTVTPPSALAQTAFSNVLATFSDANVSATPGDFTAAISWGDGTTSGGAVKALGGGAFEVLGVHTYATPGTLPFGLSVQDRGGKALSGTGTAQVSAAPTTLHVLGVNEHYTFNSQQETVTAQATGPDGRPVVEGSITFTDAGQSQTVPVSNGTASATFTFPIGHEIPGSHPIGVSFADPGAVYLATTATATAPDTTSQYYIQIFEDLLFLLLLTGSTGG